VALRRRGASEPQRRSVFWLCWLLAAQGVVGTVQYALELPAELVWVHITLAALTWLALLWAVAAAGRLAPRPAREPRRVAASA
jgi:cytochrome c oxidase assembly protein subunit 15